MSEQDLITIRDFVEDDRAFILATWLRGLYYGGQSYSDIPKDIFMSTKHAALSTLLESPGVDIKVSCLKEDPSVILGYSVYTNTVLHWLFCKSRWRRTGVATSLLPPKLTAVTHLTDLGKKLLKKRPGVHYNPFLS